MKTRKQILVAVFITIAIATSTAQAGLLDWFTGSNQNPSTSFDQLYASVTTPGVTKANTLGILDSSNAVVGFASPSKTPVSTTGNGRTYWVDVSGYNSEVGQCDDSPFITASGTHVHDGTVAANIIDANGRNMPFGTLIKIPSLYGDKIFVVEDRLNKRYTHNVDVWFEFKADALKLGRRHVQIVVVN